MEAMRAFLRFASLTVGLGLLVTGTATAQVMEPVPAPPGSQPMQAPPQRLEPLQREPLLEELGGSRLRLSLGGHALLFDGERARGFDQIETVGLDKPRMALRVNLEARWRLGEVVRLGVAGGLDWTRNTEDEDDVPRGGEQRSSALRTGYLEAVLVLGVTRVSSPTVTTDIGLRLAGGGGLSSWVWNDEAELGMHYRMSGAFDVSFLIGRDTANGIGLRIGWSHVRSGPFGPLDLRFDLSGPFLDIGYVHGW